MEILNAKEKLFCYFYARDRNGRDAARLAGYTVFPEKAAVKLLSREQIKNEIERVSKGSESFGEAAAGLRRIAFGNVSDAVHLMLAQGDEIDVGGLDLFNVSEIKMPKNGGMEIKFFDRIKALEKLSEISNAVSDEGVTFYRALEKSAQSVGALAQGEKYD